jgi:hypothetical protein
MSVLEKFGTMCEAFAGIVLMLFFLGLCAVGGVGLVAAPFIASLLFVALLMTGALLGIMFGIGVIRGAIKSGGKSAAEKES